LIDSEEIVKKKMGLIETMIDIEIATNLMKTSETDEEATKLQNNYASLKTTMKPIDKKDEMFKRLERYALDTHDRSYFSGFDLEVMDVFEIERQGERERFKNAGWDNNHNRVLLWHGSRLTNWAGILSQGLRIAPPEAPKTGYRFGKGVYFADIISKSGSYCFTSNESPVGVMLLAEVALGNMNELKTDQYMEKAPPGTDSTKALGMTAPAEKSTEFILNKVKVPLGKPEKTGLHTSCSHNEYIIYDVAQINIRYLLKIKFNHKSRGW